MEQRSVGVGGGDALLVRRRRAHRGPRATRHGEPERARGGLRGVMRRGGHKRAAVKMQQSTSSWYVWPGTNQRKNPWLSQDGHGENSRDCQLVGHVSPLFQPNPQRGQARER